MDNQIIHSEFPWLGVIFWVGVFTWFGVKAWTRYLAEQEKQKTLRAFAERGTPMDKETLEKMFSPGSFVRPSPAWQPSPHAGARALALVGCVILFVGIGLLIGAQLAANIEPDALWGMSTGGVIVGCLGLGFLSAAFILRRMREKDRANGAGDAPQ